jgi:tRNA A37 threonylcarbamoyladenosine biosynthesis protein TsaE
MCPKKKSKKLPCNTNSCHHIDVYRFYEKHNLQELSNLNTRNYYKSSLTAIEPGENTTTIEPGEINIIKNSSKSHSQLTTGQGEWRYSNLRGLCTMQPGNLL